MRRLTRDGMAEPVSRDQILRHARGQGNIVFPVQLTTSRIGNHTRLIHTLLYVMTIHTYIHTLLYVTTTTTTTTVVPCTLNSRLLSGHLGVITVGDLFSPSVMIRWVCNSRDPVLCARVLLLRNVFRKI